MYRPEFRFGRIHRGLKNFGICIAIFLVSAEWQDPAARNRARSHLSRLELIDTAASLRLVPWERPAEDSEALISLGQKLFFDPEFSLNGQVSCSTCHRPERSFTDGKVTGEGLAPVAMNTPTLVNAYASHWFFYDGRADSLAMQALGPVENVKEHGFSRYRVYERLLQTYRTEYEGIFGPFPDIQQDMSSVQRSSPEPGPPPLISDTLAAYALGTLGSKELQSQLLYQAHKDQSQPIHTLKNAASMFQDPLLASSNQDVDQVYANFGLALAAFERTIHTSDSAFDRFADLFKKLQPHQPPELAFVPGFGQDEYEGFRIFAGPGNCTTCHQGPQFTDQQFHNVGLSAREGRQLDLGRAQGILLRDLSAFRCEGPYLKQAVPSESCREIEYINRDQTEWIGAFKTPTLRNLKDTAPYAHDGRFAVLRDVLTYYNDLPDKPAVGHTEESLQALALDSNQLRQLEAFLISLSSEVHFGISSKPD